MVKKGYLLNSRTVGGRLDQLRNLANILLCMIGAATLFILMLVITANVTVRYLRYPLPGVLELGSLSLAVIIFSTLAYTQAEGKHIRVLLVLERLPLRVQLSIDYLLLFLGLVFCAFLVWQSGVEGWAAYVAKEFSYGVIKFPIWVSKMIIPIGTFVFGIELLTGIIKKAYRRSQPCNQK